MTFIYRIYLYRKAIFGYILNRQLGLDIRYLFMDVTPLHGKKTEKRLQLYYNSLNRLQSGNHNKHFLLLHKKQDMNAWTLLSLYSCTLMGRTKMNLILERASYLHTFYCFLMSCVFASIYILSIIMCTLFYRTFPGLHRSSTVYEELWRRSNGVCVT